MANPFDLDHHFIEELNALQLTDLLRRLLLLEAARAKIPASSIDVSLKIEVADGGEDGSIRWKGGPSSTEYLPNRFTQFQCKACSLTPAGWKREILTDTGAVKPAIHEALSQRGTYIGVTTQTLNREQKTKRINGIREALLKAGAPYAKSAKIVIYDANLLVNWASTSLATVLFIRNAIGRPLPYPVFSNERLKNSISKAMRFAFVPTPDLLGQIELIRNEITKSKSITRIVGLSGLGKTRLFLESLQPARPQEELSLAIIQSRLIYSSAATAGPQNIKEMLDRMIVENVDAFFVVDDCPIALHSELQKQLAEATSDISLLTIDFSLDRVGGTSYINLSPVPESAIKEMLKQAYRDFSPSQIDRIAAFAAGFPKMAEILADAQLSRDDNTALLNDDVVLGRMLWGRSQEIQETKEVLMALSLFDHFGAYEELEPELRWISENIVHKEHARVFRVVQEYADRGILQRQGRYLHMIPEPLAIRLAADWWKGTPTTTIHEIVAMEMPEGLSSALARRISRLDFLPQAKEFIADLCGAEGPFGRAEGLFSERGSALFRSLSEINPVAAADALWRVIGPMTPEAIKAIEKGRRNLVWTLEKLLFLRETFRISARALFRLAAHENESWSNNATGVFEQLFALYLPGTEATYRDRIEVVKEIMKEEKPETLVVLPHAISRSYMTGPYTRSGGIERMGSSLPRDDYKPKIWGEIFSYWSDITDILITLKQEHADLTEPIMKGLSDALFHLSVRKQYTIVERIVEMASALEEPWKEGIDSIDNLLRRDFEQVDAETRLKLSDWRNRLLPKSIRGKLLYHVSEASWNRMSKQGESYQDDSYIEAIDLAKQLSDKTAEVTSNLDLLLIGEQRHTLKFAEALANYSDQHSHLMARSLDFMKRNTTLNLNPSFLSGVLLSLRQTHPEVYHGQIAILLMEESLEKYMVRLMIPLSPNEGQLEILVKMAASGKIPVEDFALFVYGGATQAFSIKQLSGFIRSLSDVSGYAANIALDILFMYQFSKPETRSLIRPLEIELLASDRWILNERDRRGIDLYHIAELLKVLEATGGIPLDLVKRITRRIGLQAAGIGIHKYFNEVMETLMKADLGAVWEVLSEILLGPDSLASYSLQTLLRNPFEHGTGSLAQDIPEDLLWRWCQANPDRAPAILATILPPLMSMGGNTEMNSLVMKIIATYCDQKGVLSALSANLGTYSTWGSAIPHFNELRSALLPLTKHGKVQIRNWARSYVSYLERQIEHEKTQEAERDVPRS